MGWKEVVGEYHYSPPTEKHARLIKSIQKKVHEEFLASFKSRQTPVNKHKVWSVPERKLPLLMNIIYMAVVEAVEREDLEVLLEEKTKELSKFKEELDFLREDLKVIKDYSDKLAEEELVLD